MLVIDQGRAHQRVLYEQFLTNITVQKASSQQLLFPLELYFSSDEMILLKRIAVFFRKHWICFLMLSILILFKFQDCQLEWLKVKYPLF